VGSFGAFGRSVGDFGSQVGQGYDINLGWKERLQQMAFEQARQKQNDLMAPLLLQQLQQQIKQMGQPTYEGTAPLPGGGTGAITFDRNAGAAKVNPLVPAYITPDAVGRQILNGRQTLSPNDQPYADSLLGELKMGVDPVKVMDKWQQFFAGASKAQKQKPPVVDVNKGTVTLFDAFGNGTELPIYDAEGNINPQLPPEVQPLVASQVSAFDVKETRKQTEEENQNKLILDRMQKTEDFRTKQTETSQKRADATKAVTEAINAFKNYQSQQTGAQKIGMASHWYSPGTWGQEAAAKPRVDEALQDLEGKRQDAVQKLKDAGMPIPQWLNQPIGGSPTDLPGVTPAQ
jgi:hypothetical protein